MENISHILLKAGGALLMYFAPVSPLIHAVLFLFIIDWVTGYWKSRVFKRYFCSYRLRKSVRKGLSYMAAIICAHVFDTNILGAESWHIATITAGYIGLTELTSIYENLSQISGEDTLLNIIKDINKRVKEKFSKP